jgi:hypothetical protein
MYHGDGVFAASVSPAGGYTILQDPTDTSLSVSPATVTYGHEQAALITALTFPRYPDNSAYQVDTTSLALPGRGFICYGGCFVTLPATAYPAGTVKASAAFAGNLVLAASSSPVRTLLVRKATSKTVLTLSAVKVTYGHEQKERLSVTVSPQYAGTPGGVVTIKHGTTVLCKVTLSNGKGSCTLSATRLAVGVDHLFAAYAGNGNFTASSSAPKALTIVG